jgi:ketosteroid isomerase-like protein
MTLDEVQRWLDAYVAAWRTYDIDSIANLFSQEATYAYQPWAEPIQGRDAIVTAWLSDQDDPNSWEAAYRPLFVDGEHAVVVGETSYVDEKDYANLFVLRFDDDGSCSAFTEWYMPKPIDG